MLCKTAAISLESADVKRKSTTRVAAQEQVSVT
jgi:hypothetical protein